MPGCIYAAAGARGQYAMIIPSENVVIVRRGFDKPDEDGFDVPRFVVDVLAMLESPADNHINGKMSYVRI